MHSINPSSFRLTGPGSDREARASITLIRPLCFTGGGGCKVATGITDPRAEVVATQVAEVGGGEDPQAEEETPRAANVCVWARQPTTPLGSARRPHATNAVRRATYNVAAPISSKSPSAHGSVGSFGRRIARE